jgi:hypothetical protein
MEQLMGHLALRERLSAMKKVWLDWDAGEIDDGRLPS